MKRKLQHVQESSPSHTPKEEDDEHGGGGCLFFGSRPKQVPPPVAAALSYKNTTHDEKDLPEGERLLIQDMNNLSMEERQTVYEEIHGVHPEHPEPPAMVQAALTEVQRLLAKPKKGMTAYDRAAFLVPQRVQDESLLLQFLRHEKFHVRSAAHRVRKYFELAYETFGVDGILRDVRMDDLDADDLETLRTGMMQPLVNVTDRAGRPILMFFSNHGRFKTVRNAIRVSFYVYTRVLRQEAVQKKGLVMCSWIYGDFIPPATPELISMASKLYDSLPLTIAAFHLCYDRPTIASLLELTKLAMGRNTRIRLRTHFGSPLECKYSLLTFGIDASKFPLVNDDYDMDPRPFATWVTQQEQLDQKAAANDTKDGMIIPSSRDVLLGRGQPFRIFPGNRDLMDWIASHYAMYQSTPVGPARQALLEQVTDAFGRRFLKRSDGVWVVVDRPEILAKMDHGFRNHKVMQRYHEQHHHNKKHA